MHLKTRNVNTAFTQFVNLFNDDGLAFPNSNIRVVKVPSRNGPVMMIDEPVMITYSHPKERVLFNKARDCNHTFHVMEALWMLAGRNDVESLAFYTSKMAQFSDDGKTFNGAYGYRWRHYELPFPNDHKPPVDQLNELVNHLKADPNSRRAVLSMWNVEDDLLQIGQKCNCVPPCSSRIDYSCGWKQSSKDVCCNLNIMFAIRDVKCPYDNDGDGNCARHQPACPVNRYLDMTVTNRSNDMILGMLGANYVHFTFLQEYMAARIGVEVGRYHHMTNNLHVYESNWKPKEWLGSKIEGEICYPPDFAKPYQMIPLVKDPAIFEKELPSFVGNAYGEGVIPTTSRDWQEPFFRGVAGPLLRAYAWHRKGDTKQALSTMESVASDDWRIAGTNWLTKRSKK